MKTLGSGKKGLAGKETPDYSGSRCITPQALPSRMQPAAVRPQVGQIMIALKGRLSWASFALTGLFRRSAQTI
jgi:hypothetical protein